MRCEKLSVTLSLEGTLVILGHSISPRGAKGHETQPTEFLQANNMVCNEVIRETGGNKDVNLFGSQQAAIARLRYAVTQYPSLVALCGPGGSGVTTVLNSLSANLRHEAHVVRIDLSTLVPLQQIVSGAKSEAIVFIIDNSHLASDGMLGSASETIWKQSPSASVVLGGRGRLLTLLARDPALLDKVLFRSVLQPVLFCETLAVVQSELVGAGLMYSERVPEVIHEVTAGIPKNIFRLIDMVRLVGEGCASQPIEVADIEQIHERLNAAAA